MLDLLEKSNKLKSKWNRLNVEHTAFLTKRETAKKYVRQVRNYINEAHNRREHEKYRQKKLDLSRYDLGFLKDRPVKETDDR